MDKLPSVFANKIDKEINNVQSIYYGESRSIEHKDSISVSRKINNIFSSTSHVYKSKVSITLSDKIIERIIVGKTSSNLITIDGELIPIANILDIVKI